MKVLYKILDYLISLIMGAGTVLLVQSVISNNWNMLLAMLVGMILGIMVLLVSVLVFTPVATAFELFPVGMIITMFVGMGAGMARAAGELNFRSLLVVALLFSLLVQSGFDLYNRKIKGDVPLESKD